MIQSVLRFLLLCAIFSIVCPLRSAALGQSDVIDLSVHRAAPSFLPALFGRLPPPDPGTVGMEALASFGINAVLQLPPIVATALWLSCWDCDFRILVWTGAGYLASVFLSAPLSAWAVWTMGSVLDHRRTSFTTTLMASLITRGTIVIVGTIVFMVLSGTPFGVFQMAPSSARSRSSVACWPKSWPRT